jgi:hypothetical protein
MGAEATAKELPRAGTTRQADAVQRCHLTMGLKGRKDGPSSLETREGKSGPAQPCLPLAAFAAVQVAAATSV